MELGCIPPLGEVPVAVQDVNADVNLFHVLLDVVVRFVVPIFDVVLLPDDVEVVLTIIVVVLLVDDVDKVDEQADADVLGFPQFSMYKFMLRSSCANFSRTSFSLM